MTSPLSQYRLLSDEELVYRYAHRSEEAAMHMIYERYSHLVFGVCLHYLNDVDAAQETTRQIFIRLLNDLARFDIVAFKPWLLQVCRNQCQIFLRKMGKSTEVIMQSEDAVFESALPDGMSEEHLAATFTQGLKQLSPEQQKCIRLFYEERKPYADIAAGTGLSRSQIKQHIQMGKSMLSRHLIHLAKTNPS